MSREKATARERQVHLFNAEGKVLGRLAVEIAGILRGKNSATFAPHVDHGDVVIVANAAEVVATGRKKEQKTYYRFSGYPGGIKEITLGDQLEKDARKVIVHAVEGMLPKNKLRARMLRRLHVYNDATHPHTKIDITHN